MTYDEINKDIAYLSEHIASANMEIPSAIKIWRACFAIPLLGFVLNLISFALLYSTLRYQNEGGMFGFLSYIGNEALYIIAACFVIGCVMALMSYQYVLAYYIFSANAKRNSLLLKKAKGLAVKLVSVFSVIALCTSIATLFVPMFVLSIPILMVAFIFISSFIINAELIRLGMAPAFKKMIQIVKKI